VSRLYNKLIRDLKSDIHKSQHAVAKVYGVPRSTLVDRLKGSTSMRASHPHQQRLTPKRESFLVDWILE
jgi:hypothetical protein